jgi:GDP-mannose 6-dehydrogenase
MRISVFGLGYVGTVCAGCLADRGHTVVGVDKSETKVNLVQSGHSPIVEVEIGELIRTAVGAGRLTATVDAEHAVASTDLSIICVGTPSRSNGSLNLEAIETVTTEIGNAIRSKATRHLVAVRSTVVPGTTRGVIVPRLVQESGKEPGAAFGVAFNPEFLREGSSVKDFNNPSKTVVGGLDESTAAAIMSLYEELRGPKIITEIETAELAKYVDNSWHALKVVFGNEIGRIGKSLGIDSNKVMDIFFEDKRLNISPAYLRPGFAFGGSCLPKDLRALNYLSRTLDLSLPILNNIFESNRLLIEHAANWILNQSRKRIAFLGISFKSGTDDVRESPFVDLVERLIGKGCEIRIFDPNVRLSHLVGANKEYLNRVLPHVTHLMVPEISDALDWAELIVVTTANPTYRSGILNARRDQVVLDFCRLDLADTSARVEGFLW